MFTSSLQLKFTGRVYVIYDDTIAGDWTYPVNRREVISNSWLCNGLSGTTRSPGACDPLSCVRALFPLLYS
ncbi:hypothetical protein CHARACLAT_000384 [Characodon lateralis]|uniref:Uncharacterized protein n=1 Tax=Characodon lateralis TaxID=208331 RepID=A0ABU7EZ32_9TELE|nr:hypothetical protein [Characodon lateralis]